MRVAGVIAGVFLFLFLAGCVSYDTGGRYADGSPQIAHTVVDAHDHRCPVDGAAWSHRKRSCVEPRESPCKSHR